jgi:hypothetical protein
MLPWRALGGLATVAVVAVLSLSLGAAAGPAHAVMPRMVSEPANSLQIYYTSPVLSRAGERVLMPVQVVCMTAGGTACRATVTLGTRAPGEAWHYSTAPATPGLTFDLTAPAARVETSGSSGSVDFFIEARDPAGVSMSLPPGGQATPLSFFVTKRIAVLGIPHIAFGNVRAGTTVLALPWGTGPTRAGVSLGRESATVGPSSFDVDARGRVYLLDSLQKRLAVFSEGRLLRATSMPMSPEALVAVDADGDARVLDRAGAMLTARDLDPSGTLGGTAGFGSGIVSAIRMAGGRAYGLILPLDAWVKLPPASPSAGPSTASPVSPGLPTAAGDQLIRVSRIDGVRLGRVSANSVTDAIELRGSERLGEIALDESDGLGGYWVVLHLWHELPSAADQYQVLHIRHGRVISTFAAANEQFAEAPPLARFRLGADGALYQLVSSPSGIRIVRFDLKEES